MFILHNGRQNKDVFLKKIISWPERSSRCEPRLEEVIGKAEEMGLIASLREFCVVHAQFRNIRKSSILYTDVHERNRMSNKLMQCRDKEHQWIRLFCTVGSIKQRRRGSKTRKLSLPGSFAPAAFTCPHILFEALPTLAMTYFTPSPPSVSPLPPPHSADSE